MSHYPKERLAAYPSPDAVQPTARGLQAALVKDLNALFRNDRHKTPHYLTDEEIEAVKPDSDPETDWTEKDKAFWTAMQRDYNRHRMAAPTAYAQELPLFETESPTPPENGAEDEELPPPMPLDVQQDGEALIPYILVKLDSGGIEEPDAPHRINVILLIAVFDDDPKNAGHTAVLEIMERIQAHYREKPTLDAFSFVEPIHWYLQDEPSYPFYYGALDFAFDAPAPQVNGWEDLV